MLPQKNNVAPIRNQIIVKVAESFIKDRFKNADKIPEEIMPDGAMFYHQNIETDREIIKNIALAVMGFCPADEEGKNKSLYEYGQEALKRDKLLPSKLSVIGMACQACMKQQHVVTNFCRGCIARPCQMNCPKGAISFTKQSFALTAVCVLTAARIMLLSKCLFLAKIPALSAQLPKMKTAKSILITKNVFLAENVCGLARSGLSLSLIK